MTPANDAPPERDYLAVQQSPEFAELRSRFRRFVFPMTAFFLIWYFVYVLLSTYAHGFMSHKLFGNITTGLVFGLLQFVTTFAVTIIYVRWANRVFDPAAEKIAAQLQGGVR